MAQATKGRGAGLLIIRPDGMAFLIRRSKAVDDPGAWDVPGGGVEAGESPIQAAVREAREEAGPLPPVSTFGSFTDNGYTTFIASIDQVDAEYWHPALGPEADGWGWYDPARPPAPLRSNVEAVFRHIL